MDYLWKEIVRIRKCLKKMIKLAKNFLGIFLNPKFGVITSKTCVFLTKIIICLFTTI